MKLSVSAYRAHASAHKKILDTTYNQYYGSTSASHLHPTPSTSTSAAGITPNSGFQIEPPLQAPSGSSSSTSTAVHQQQQQQQFQIASASGNECTAITTTNTILHLHQENNASYLNVENGGDGGGGGYGGGDERDGSGDGDQNFGGSSDDANTPLHSPLRSQHADNDDDDDDDSSNANESDCNKSPSQSGNSDDGDDDDNYDSTEDNNKKTSSSSFERPKKTGETVAGKKSRTASKPATQSWRNLRAVMAYYNSLRKIKRTKSNQRWMKLRTTVQISSAISTKKPPLKREDSFLQRFSTRQIPEAQETVEDTGSEGCTGENRSVVRRRRKRLKQPRSVVNPDSNFYFYWLFILTICFLYNLWTVIVRQSFPELQEMVSTFWFTCDSISDLVFLFDLAVQFRTGYLEQGLMVYDSKKLACHYFGSRAFLIDILALSPTDLLQLHFGVTPILRSPRFLKVYRAVSYYYMVESRTVWPNLWRVVNLIHILLILAHWFGCFYFLLSQSEEFKGDWVYPYRPGDYATLTRKYLGSLYWSTLTLTTIGDLPTPETNLEKTDSVDGPRSLPRRGVKSRLLQFRTSNGYIFTIVSYLIGVFIFATIVGQVGNVITNRNANRLEFERLLDGAKTYMRHHKVPGEMKRRVLRWYDYSWSRGRIQGGGDINTALGLLPDKLKTELALHVNLNVLKKVTIFQECQPEFLRDLVLKMKAYIFTPGDSICRKGEVAREMFIIADGILEVISETGKVLTTMKAGDFFGEIGILNLDGLNKRTADVRSVGYSELFSLSREDVLAAMKDYPEAQEILQALGRKRLMELLQVKASAKQPVHHHHHQHHHHQQQQQQQQHRRHGAQNNNKDKGLVDKLKSEAKGLKNVLKKSRTHRCRSEEDSLELQPFEIIQHGNGNGTSKGNLKRMPRVKSNELSQERNEDEKRNRKDSSGGGAVGTAEHDKSHHSTPSPLGAGLPLLQRLRLLKEKQEREEKQKNQHQTSPLLSPAQSSSIRSPPAIAEEETSFVNEPPPPPPPPDPNLPFLQRILLLKAREEKAATKSTKVSYTGSYRPPLLSTIKGSTTASCSQPTSPTPVSGPQNLSALSSRASFSAAMPTKLLINNKLSIRDRFKLHTNTKEKDSSIKDSLLKDSDPPAITDLSCSSSKLSPNKINVPNLPSTNLILKSSSSSLTTECILSQQNNERNNRFSNDNNNSNGSSSSSSSNNNNNIKDKFINGNNIRNTNNKLSEKRYMMVIDTTRSTESVECKNNEAHWMKLKRAAISEGSIASIASGNKETVGEVTVPEAVAVAAAAAAAALKEGTNKNDERKSENKEKPTAKATASLLTRKTKHYRSIDDLSPEYGPLPFVKKLKILNERQKLEELEIAMKTRSFSLDIPECPNETSDTLTRSHSEGSSMHQDQRSRDEKHHHHHHHQQQQQQQQFLCTPSLAPSPLHSSNESNETPERRNLKSILKKLSEDTKDKDCTQKKIINKDLGQITVEKMPDKMDSTEFRRLMRAPTIEGYAARHSKLSKSVTFNRDTLQSPPNSANSIQFGAQPSHLFQFPSNNSNNNNNNNNNNNGSDSSKDKEIINNEAEQSDIQLVPNKKKLLKSSLDEQQYFADILLAIKQVISTHLQDLQEKFQERFDKLETELRGKNELITKLKSHIYNLEKCTDDSLSDSIDTIISRDKHSWDEQTYEEKEELQELPQPINASWAASSSSIAATVAAGASTVNKQSQNSIVLNIDSTTDTESEDAADAEGDGEISEENDLPTDCDDYESTTTDDGGDQYENSSSNWEMELLAAQIRERRTASLDHNNGGGGGGGGGQQPPIRNRFLRGSSFDGGND